MAQEKLHDEAVTASTVRRYPLWLVSLATVVASILVNLIVLAIAFALVPLPTTFLPLQWQSIVIMTALGAGPAVGVYALIRRFSKRPVQVYTIVAVVALLISIIPNIQMISNPTTASFPGVTLAAAWLLLVFHFTTAIICIVMLTRLAPPAEKRA